MKIEHPKRIVLFASTALCGLLLLILVFAGLAVAWRPAAEEARGDRLFRAGDAAQAELIWQALLDAQPDRASTRNKLVVLAMNAGAYSRAEALLQEGIRRSPRVASFHFNLGLLHFMQVRDEDALAALDRVLELNPLQSEAHFLKGALYRRMGREAEAQEEFVRELNVDPATPEAWAAVLDRPMALSDRWMALVHGPNDD